MLGIHNITETIQNLIKIVTEKTKGNPFFIHQVSSTTKKSFFLR